MADSERSAPRSSEGGSPRLAKSAGIFGLATITSRILGLAREQVMAYYFGANDANDAFRIASRIPNLVRDLFAEGAMSAAFVPTFTRHLTLEGKEKSFRLANSVINALLIVTGLIVLLGMVFAEPIVRMYAGNFANVPGKLELTIFLARIVTPFLTLVAVAAVLMGMLNSMGHFFVPALSPAMFNVAGIAMAVTLIPFAPRLGVQPITIVALATLVGGLGQLAIQWTPLRKEGFRYQPTLDLRDEGLRRVLFLMGPGTLGMAATQINVFVNTMLATSQGTGAVSWLDFAFRLMYLPIGLFGADPTHPCRRTRPDDVPEPARDCGADRAGAADHRRDLRAWAIHRSRHGCHDCGAAVLRDRAGRLLPRPHHLADVLCPWAQPHSRARVGEFRHRQHCAERHAGAGAWLQGPCARHVDDGDRECRRADVAVAPGNPWH
jgi:hypothetical protein